MTKTVHHESHGLADRVGLKTGNLARDGTAKRVYPVHVAMGQHRTQGTNIGAPVTTPLSSIPDASNPLASDPTKIGKRLSSVAFVPGQRSRGVTKINDMAELGRAILAEGRLASEGKRS